MFDPVATDEQISDASGQAGSGLLMAGDGRTFAYDPHPLAELFPMIGGPEFAALVEDVRENGVRRPIVLFEGKVLDGRNRYMAAREVGCGYPVVEFTGSDPLAYVISENLRRRHLTESQRGMVTARLAKMPAHRPAGNPANLPTSATMTQPEAAALMNVSERTARTARVVADQGTPALVAAVEAGEVSVSAAAEVARLPEAEQVEIVAQGPKAVRETAKAARQKPEADPKPVPEPVDPERRKLAKLTTDALIDEVLGLRADLADEKAKVAEVTADRDTLKTRLAEATSSDLGRALGNAQRREATAVGRMKEYQATAKRLEFRLKKAEERVKELESMEVSFG